MNDSEITLIKYQAYKKLCGNNHSKPFEKTLAEAVTKFVDSLHHIYSGIKVKPVSNYEDEDFTFEISIPKDLSIDEVLETCHKECIKVEDEYDLFILPKVIYEQ